MLSFCLAFLKVRFTCRIMFVIAVNCVNKLHYATDIGFGKQVTCVPYFVFNLAKL